MKPSLDFDELCWRVIVGSFTVSIACAAASLVVFALLLLVKVLP